VSPEIRQCLPASTLHTTQGENSTRRGDFRKGLTHVYEVLPRKDHRRVNLISDALPFGRLWYLEVSDAIGYAKFRSRSHDASAFTMMLARAGGLLLSRQTLRAARFLCRMRIAASSARRFNSASSGVIRKNSKRRLLISSSPVLFAPSFLCSTRRAFSRAAATTRGFTAAPHDAVIRVYDDAAT
jgi:hypothetical protein